MSRAPLPPINFRGLAEALLAQAHNLMPRWLPGGVRRGHEWVCASLAGGEGTSCSVNLANGKWADFAGEEKGGDLVSLYAAIHDLDMGAAALQVAREEGLESVAGIVASAQAAGDVPQRVPPPPAPAPPASTRPPREPEGWRTQLPVPPHAPEPTFWHQYRQPQDIVHKARYHVGGQVLGYVVRFRTSDGGKETLPYTWCVSERDGGAKWHWRQWDEPRPLYYPGGEHPAGRTVVVVEGEIKAEVLQDLLDHGAPGVYCVVSWPGGSKAWRKALWEWLRGCTVLLWADCDSKREQLTKKERDACVGDAVALEVAKAAKPFLPAEKQPGMSAMLGIGHQLQGELACQVQLLPIDPPGVKPDGWDARDAIEADGWDFARVAAFFGQGQPLPPSPSDRGASGQDGAAAGHSGGPGGGKNGAPPTGGGGDTRQGEADDEGDDDPFQEHLDFMCERGGCKVWDLGVNRKLLITALRKAPALSGCLAFDELRNAPCTRSAWPWRQTPGALADADDLRLNDWLSSEYKLKAASRAALAEAIDTVADERRFHPIRDWLVEQQHDCSPRLEKWLIHVLGMDPEKLAPKRRRYLELMGRFLLMGLVARVMDPGCKFDYSPVFEGVAGIGKSTLAKELVGAEFFSDTHFDIGNGKDGMEQLEGLWIYELSEMTAFRRADSEQIKQFFSSTIDRFRGAYGRYVQPHPRQCVIVCTTNKRQYLYDLTGNRRFWPVWIDQRIKIEWLRKWRGQLFAEALAAYRAGERYYPTPEEEEQYFVPEQRKRLVETAVQSKLYELLTRDGARGGEGKVSSDLNQHTEFVTLTQLVAALGADAAKSTNVLESQIRGWLEAMGWQAGRESTGQRRRGYRRPKPWPPEIEDEEDIAAPSSGPDGSTPPAQGDVAYEEGSDDAPF